MKQYLIFAVCVLLLASCHNDLAFDNKSFHKKTTMPCRENCPHINVKIPFAKNVPVVADSINNKIFSVMKEIIYVGEKPYDSTDYDGLLTAFINSYEEMQKKFPTDTFGWEGEIEGNIIYESDNILNIEIKHYTFTGGAHGYSGQRSLIFNPKTGKSIPNDKLFKDTGAFAVFAEKKFREHYKIPENAPINSTGLMFEEEKFELPQTYFFTNDGFLLYYNVYEIASYADGPKALLLSYDQMKPYLAVK
jgi:hypothetical protein